MAAVTASLVGGVIVDRSEAKYCYVMQLLATIGILATASRLKNYNEEISTETAIVQDDASSK